MKKYKTGGLWSPEINAVEVSKETEKSVWVTSYGGRQERRNKVTDYEAYHDSWKAARDHLINKANKALASAEKRVDHAKATLEKIELISLRESDEG